MLLFSASPVPAPSLAGHSAPALPRLPSFSRDPAPVLPPRAGIETTKAQFPVTSSAWACVPSAMGARGEVLHRQSDGSPD